MFDLLYPSTPAPIYPRPSVDNPGKASVDAQEMLPLVRPDGRVYGQASRAWCHSGSAVLHPVVHLHILDREGRLCLQKRSATKDLLPGYWDTAVGGHVSYGEQVLEALYREAAEELGISSFNPLFLEHYVYATERDRELVVVFAIVGHPQLKANPEEVSDCRWFTREELSQAMEDKVLTPNFEREYLRLQERLYALL